MEKLNQRDSFVSCSNSQSAPVRGTLIHMTGQTAVFELYNPYSILQMSEVLSDFQIIIGERQLYSGRAVVSSLVNTGIMLVVETTLVDPWSDLDILAILKDKTSLRKEIERYVSGWETENKILPELKVLVTDFSSFLHDISIWVKQVEVALSRQASSSIESYTSELVGEVTAPTKSRITEFLQGLENLACRIDSETAGLHKAYTRRILHPYTLCSPFVHRSYTKPLGYAGDYLMIDMLLSNPHKGEALFSKVVNTLILESDVCQAHRNRIEIMTQMLDQEGKRTRKLNRRFKVLNIACGPSRDVVNFIYTSNEANRCDITLLDFSQEALEFSEAETKKAKKARGSEIGITIVNKSIDSMLRESTKKAGTSDFITERYDVVYCAGLFDYLTDSVCNRLISLYYEWLLPDGLLMVTNVHSSNPQRYMMEYLLEWNIFARDEKKFTELNTVPVPSEVFLDGTGVNLFLKMRNDNSVPY